MSDLPHLTNTLRMAINPLQVNSVVSCFGWKCKSEGLSQSLSHLLFCIARSRAVLKDFRDMNRSVLVSIYPLRLVTFL